MNTQEKQPKLYSMGCMAFFFSGICAMSSGVIVSLLQEYYGFAYGMTGTLLSLMNIGNLVAGFASAILPSKIGTRATVMTLTSGYALGYLFMTTGNYMWLLMLAFLFLGLAKGNTINNCTVLVGNNAKDRTKGMNVMHASYACGALLGPILITAALTMGKFTPMYALAVLGLVLWLVFVAGAGNMLNAASMGIMLPAAGLGAILMPWIIGMVAEGVSLQAGMFCNIVPCVGILVFSLLCRRLGDE